jgi:hypothetical protein
MASGTWKLYASAGGRFANANINWTGDATIKVMLCTSTYTPNQTTHTTKSNVTNEVSGTGYTARGTALSGKSTSLSSLTTRLIANDVTWSTSTITARVAVIYQDSGTDATSNLIAYCVFDSDVISSAGDWFLDLDGTNGFAGLAVAA